MPSRLPLDEVIDLRKHRKLKGEMCEFENDFRSKATQTKECGTVAVPGRDGGAAC